MQQSEDEFGGVGSDLRKVINRHGHAFHNAVIRRADQLHQERRSTWIFSSAEVPVEVRGQSTRIDFVLHQPLRSGGIGNYLVAECKRANPALSNWCFARSPYIRRGMDVDRKPIVEFVQHNGGELTSEARTIYTTRDIYGLAYEIRADSKGEGAPGRGAVEEACGQLLKGVSGLVHLIRAAPHLITVNHPTPIIPVVFTTATLWVTDADVGDAALASGELLNDVEAKQVPWLWYRYHMSPGLRHEVPANNGIQRDLGDLVERWYARTVVIVSPPGIDNFLSTDFTEL